MTRFLYVCLLRLHPQRFRQRFAEEMLWIFDQAADSRSVTRLFADAFVSLLRQWALRREFWQQPATTSLCRPVSDGAPLFYTSESSMPSASALVNGALLSVAAFGTVAFLIAHGGPSGLITLPRVVIQPPEITANLEVEMPLPARRNERSALGRSFRSSDVSQTASTLLQRRSGESKTRQPGITPRESLEHLFPSVARSDSKASTAETHLDAAASEAVLLISLLDKNSDGKISTEEGSNAPSEQLQKFLDGADLNQDGFVTLEELLKALPNLSRRPR